MKKKLVSIIAIVALVAVLALVLTACNAESIEKKLDKAGYSVQVLVNKDDNVEGVEWALSAEKGELSIGGGINANIDVVYVTKYASLDDAKKSAEDAKALAEKLDNGVVKRVGKIVYCGTEQGVKDAM